MAEAILVDEAADLIERTGSVGHIVADEAQDLSPMMLRALARRSSTGSLTVLGDLAQATTPWATRSWAEALAHLGKPDAHVEQLTRGFRVPGEVIEYAARLLPVIAPGLEPPTSVRRSRGELEVVPLTSVVDVVSTASAREGSIGLIVPDAARRRRCPRAVRGRDPLRRRGPGGRRGSDEIETEFDQHLDLVPASLAKGLEFDHVVLLEPAAIVAAEPDRVTGLRRLYVCLTRAVTSLVIAHAEPLPAELGDARLSGWTWSDGRMRELNLVRAGRLEWRERPDPTLESATDALVRPFVASRCDGDTLPIHRPVSRAMQAGLKAGLIDPVVGSILGSVPFKGPFGIGHECVAQVTEVGAEVAEIKVGDVVVVPVGDLVRLM